jgi:hypothetical protein
MVKHRSKCRTFYIPGTWLDNASEIASDTDDDSTSSIDVDADFNIDDDEPGPSMSVSFQRSLDCSLTSALADQPQLGPKARQILLLHILLLNLVYDHDMEPRGIPPQPHHLWAPRLILLTMPRRPWMLTTYLCLRCRQDMGVFQ